MYWKVTGLPLLYYWFPYVTTRAAVASVVTAASPHLLTSGKLRTRRENRARPPQTPMFWGTCLLSYSLQRWTSLPFCFLCLYESVSLARLKSYLKLELQAILKKVVFRLSACWIQRGYKRKGTRLQIRIADIQSKFVHNVVGLVKVYKT